MAKKDKWKGDFGLNDEYEECGFTDSVPTGSCINNFSFDDNSSEEVNTTSINKTSSITNTDSLQTNVINKKTTTNPKINNSLYDNRRTPIANGAAPAIDGEAPEVRRCYVLRASTIRKLNEIKAKHPDVNICVSTIVDMAIDYYYENSLK